MSNNSFKVKNALTLTPVDLSQVVNPQAGDLACDVNDSNKIKRYDANSSAWTEVGSGGVGGTDILFVQDFESASLSSFTQTGLSLSQTESLHGKVSALLVHQPATSQSFKQVISVDRKFRGESMTLRLNAKSNATAGNVTINIYDETNAANLVASEQLQLSNDTSGALSRVGFTIPSTCASLSYTITALQESGSPETRIDDIIAELAVTSLLETSVEVPVVTAWQGYTPTFQGFGTPTNIEFEWRQVGENAEIRGKFTSGTSTGVEARVGLPGGLTSAGTSLIPSIQQAGTYGRGLASTNQKGGLVHIAPSLSYITLSDAFVFGSGSVNPLLAANGTTIASLGQAVSLTASVPCAGLSATTTKTIELTQSGLVQEADSYVYAAGNAGQSITANITNIPFIPLSAVGSDISLSADSFTVAQDGVYHLTGSIRVTTSTARAFYLYENGVVSDLITLQTSDFYPIKMSRFLEAGKTYSIRGSVTSTLFNDPALHFLRVAYSGSLRQVTVNPNSKITIPTSELRMEGASTRGATATVVVRFDTVAKIRGDAFTVTSTANDGTFVTMTKAGRLDVSATLFNAALHTLGITKNQTTLTTTTPLASESVAYQGAAAGSIANASAQIDVTVGDIIRVISSANPSTSTVNTLTLSFQEQDISVSVTNTLPQFSDSDSSVRVDGGNGFGSTATQIRRFSNIRDNLGVDVEYADSAAGGATFTVKSNGVYSISYTDTAQTNGAYIGISKNSTQLTTSIDNIDAADRLALERSLNLGITESMNVSWTGYLNSGDIIRPHTSGQSTSVVQAALFTVTIQGKPNVTGVDVTAFVNIPQPVSQTALLKNTTSPSSSANLSTSAIRQSGTGCFRLNTNNTFTVLKNCIVTASFAVEGTSADFRSDILLNGVLISRDRERTTTSGVSTTVSFPAFVGDVVTFNDSAGGTVSDNYYSILAETTSDEILTAPESFSTDTASLTYAGSGTYTLATLNTAPVGTFITFTYAASTNTRTQTTVAPTQTTADMNVNGIQLFTRAYNAASTAASPSTIAIQIGKGLKGTSLNLYKSAGKVIAGGVDIRGAATTSSQQGLAHKDYNEVTGILILDAGNNFSTAVTSYDFLFSDITSQTNGYLVINASKSPALTGVPVLQPRIATLSDVKASGTVGGASTGGTYVTRTLNTLVDPSGFVTSLASNQFILPAGEYYIEGSAPAHGDGTSAVTLHKIKIRNVTDSVDSIIGSSERAATASGVGIITRSQIAGTVVISSPKTFELQHRTAVTVASTGFGTSTSFGDTEVYSTLTITKVK